MNYVLRLAQELRRRDNPTKYTPMFGKIIALPNLQILVGDRILLDRDDIEKALFDLYETRIHDGRTLYVNLNKEVLLLPYSDDNKFIAVGVVV